MDPLPKVTLTQLECAVEASWRADTAYSGVEEAGNPSLGQCYPTSRVVQWFFPHFEIVSGRVDTGSSLEAHFWNLDPAQDPAEQVDLTWRQFPVGARVVSFVILERHELNDSAPTVRRCELLLRRVLNRLAVADGF